MADNLIEAHEGPVSAERMSVQERFGLRVGWALAPAFAAAGRVRHARLFQPRGVVLSARVEACTDTLLGRLLVGPALVRFCTALWRHGREWPDVLCCAVRFRRRDTPADAADGGDQDILFATVRTPLTTPLGPLRTHVHDFLDNRYHARASFDAPGIGRAKLRLTPECRSPEPEAGSRRGLRLASVVARGDASLVLEARRVWTRSYRPIVRITLLGEVGLDDDALRFSPFRCGRGLVPRGFVHALRHGSYAATRRWGVTERR
jgi:hypothetical protein